MIWRNFECWAPADLNYDIISPNQALSQPTRNLILPEQAQNQSGVENPH